MSAADFGLPVAEKKPVVIPDDVLAMTPAAIEAELAAMGRPAVVWHPPQAFFENAKRLAEWDATDKSRRERYVALRERLLQLSDAEALKNLNDKRAKATEAKFAACGAGPRLLEAAKSAKDTPALAAVKAWYNSTPRKTWLLLLGNNSTGKSTAAVRAIRRACEEGQSVAFRLVSDVAKLAQFDAGAEEFERLSRVSLLVLDDLGAEHSTGFGRGVLAALVDKRHVAFKRTVVTSNLTAEEVRKLVGPRVSERFGQDGAFVWLGGASLRQGVAL